MAIIHINFFYTIFVHTVSKKSKFTNYQLDTFKIVQHLFKNILRSETEFLVKYAGGR